MAIPETDELGRDIVEPPHKVLFFPALLHSSCRSTLLYATHFETQTVAVFGAVRTRLIDRSRMLYILQGGLHNNPKKFA
jgi:hypothetical protein